MAAVDDSVRLTVVRAAGAGMVAGAAGLVAYDVARWAVVSSFGLDVDPFEALQVFGELLVGAEASTTLKWMAGIGYHIFNGVGFAVFYAVLCGRRGVPAGLAWAFVLEAVMLAVYPGWLDIRARGEFTAVSALGHTAYGATIGFLSKRLLRRSSSK